MDIDPLEELERIDARCEQLKNSELYPEEHHSEMAMLSCAARPWEALGHKNGEYCLVAVYSIDAIIYEDEAATIPDQVAWNVVADQKDRVYCNSLYESFNAAIKALTRLDDVRDPQMS